MSDYALVTKFRTDHKVCSRDNNSGTFFQCTKNESKSELPIPRMHSSQVQIRKQLKKKALQVQVMTARRRKLWALMVKKEICKVISTFSYTFDPIFLFFTKHVGPWKPLFPFCARR